MGPKTLQQCLLDADTQHGIVFARNCARAQNKLLNAHQHLLTNCVANHIEHNTDCTSAQCECANFSKYAQISNDQRNVFLR